jgi:hypothetical protein
MDGLGGEVTPVQAPSHQRLASEHHRRIPTNRSEKGQKVVFRFNILFTNNHKKQWYCPIN